jgi:hypothetical protein
MNGRTEHWDERGPCNGPRDCVGTERGCAYCDPRPIPHIGRGTAKVMTCIVCGNGWPCPTILERAIRVRGRFGDG